MPVSLWADRGPARGCVFHVCRPPRGDPPPNGIPIAIITIGFDLQRERRGSLCAPLLTGGDASILPGPGLGPRNTRQMNKFKADGRILTCTSHLRTGERQEPLLGEVAGWLSTGEEEEGLGSPERSPANMAGLFCSSGQGLLLRRVTWASRTCRRGCQGSPDTRRFPSSVEIHLTRGPRMLFSERLPGGLGLRTTGGRPYLLSSCGERPPVGVSYGAQAYIRLYANVRTCVHVRVCTGTDTGMCACGVCVSATPPMTLTETFFSISEVKCFFLVAKPQVVPGNCCSSLRLSSLLKMNFLPAVYEDCVDPS